MRPSIPAETVNPRAADWWVQRPPTIVATTSTDSSSSAGQRNGSRERTTRSARKPGRSLPRRRSSPASQAGVTVEADDRLLDRERLLRVPAGPLVDRAQDARANPGERVELLDGRVRAVDDDGARVPEAPERVGTFGPVAPVAVCEVTVGGRVGELDRAGDPQLREARNVGRVEALRVLDAMTEPARLPGVPRRLEGVERVAVRPVSDGVHGDRPARLGAAEDDLLELLAARDLDTGSVEHEGRLGAERPVHERLQVAEAEEVVADSRRQRKRCDLGRAGRRGSTARRGARGPRARGSDRRSTRLRAIRPCRGSRRHPGRSRRGFPRASPRPIRPR